MKNSYRKNRILVISSLIILAGFLTINFCNYLSSKKIFIQSLSETFLPSKANSIIHTIDESHDKYRTAAMLTADSIDMDMFSDNGVENENKIRQYITKKQDELGVKNIGLVSLKSGRYYDSMGQTLVLDFSSDRDKWIQDFLSGNNDYRFSLYDPDENSNLYSFFHDYKIKDKTGAITGIFGIGLGLCDLFRVQESGVGIIKIYFTDYKGNIRLPPESKGANYYKLHETGPGRDVHVDADQDKNRTIFHNRGNSFFISLIRRLPDLKRDLVIEIDVSEYYGKMKNHFFVSFFTGTVFSLLTAVSGILIIYRSNRKLSSKVYRDPLTGIYNRSFLDYLLSADYAKTGKCGNGICLLAFDIDLFKSINDSMGHIYGDGILKQVTRIAGKHIRVDDFIIRWGGDEFIIVLHTDISNAVKIGERIRLNTEEGCGVTITAGLTELSRDESFEDALARADSVLYRGKKEGRNRVLTA